MTHRLRRSLSLVAAAALLLTLTATATAQSGDAPDPGAVKGTVGAAAKPAKGKRTKVITIEEERLEGEVPTGTILSVDARPFSKHPSLIRLRHSFVDKVLESAQEL
jgi:hypothetical protein